MAGALAVEELVREVGREGVEQSEEGKPAARSRRAVSDLSLRFSAASSARKGVPPRRDGASEPSTEQRGPLLAGEVIERRSAAVNGTGPLFWKITPGDDYPRQLKEANRELRDLTGLKDIRAHDLRRTGRTHVSGLGIRDEVGEALLNHAKEAISGTYNLYSYWPERKDALRIWHQKLAAKKASREQEAA